MSTQPPSDAPWGAGGQWRGGGGQASAGMTPPQWSQDAEPRAPGYQQMPAPEAPQTIKTAALLMYVGALLSFMGIFMIFAQEDEIREAIVESDPSLTADEVDTAMGFAQTFGVIVGLVGVGLWIWMAIMNGKGRSWARIVASVFGGLNVLSFLLGLAQGQWTGLQLAQSVLSLGLAVIILILMYMADSSRYYEAVTHYKYATGVYP